MLDRLRSIAFAAGLATLGWIAWGYLPGHPLALAMTVLIGAIYAAGALELRRFDQGTRALQQALAHPVGDAATLEDWLAPVPEALRPPVRGRIEGERVALPGPELTPFLTGLLVLLGMTGTFLGMVVTLQGTGQALERASDLASMRDSLAAPVRGLGLAFGTSVAGVVASAMLGLMAAFSRRRRLAATRRLDQLLAGPLRRFTPAHQRELAARQRERAAQQQAQALQLHEQALQLHEQALKVQQDQAQALPALVAQLQALAQQLDARWHESQQQLQAGQQRFLDQAGRDWQALATSVDRSLHTSLGEAAQVAAQTMQPLVVSTLKGLSEQSQALQDGLARRMDGQVQSLSMHLDAATQAMGSGWTQALARQERSAAEGAERLRAALKAQDEQRLAHWTASLNQLAERMATSAESQARSTIGEVARLVHSAAEAPRAAAEVVAQLREQLSASLVRDNAQLDERARLLATLDTLLGAVQHATTGQQAAVDALLSRTGELLDRTGESFAATLARQAEQQQALTADLGAGAAEVASLGEAFGAAVELFDRSSGKLMAQLQQLEQTLARSIGRSDEQLAYYVAQAREVIDLSLASQKQIVDDLQRVAARHAGAEA